MARDHRVEPFTSHDLRRSMRTRLSALSIPDELRELMIAHEAPGLHQVYDQHSCCDENRRGFKLWVDRPFAIVEPPAPNVTRRLLTGN